MRIITYLIVLLLAFIGCSKKLHYDPSELSAIDAQYPSAEFYACGQLWSGVGVCSIEEGTPLSTLEFKIQTYYQGEVVVDTQDCGTHYNVPYQNNELRGDFLFGTAKQSCVVTFTVIPQYPDQEHQTLPVSGFRGVLRIKVIEKDKAWVGKVFRFPKGAQQVWVLKAHEPLPVTKVLI